MKTTDLKVETVPLSDIRPYVNNPKLHSEEHIKQIASSIQHFGFNDPLALDESGEIIEGHGRYLAAMMLGIDTVPVIFLKHLSPAQKQAYALAHNKLTLNSGFDLELLRLEFSSLLELQEAGNLDFDLEVTGFDQSEIDELMQELDGGKDDLTDDDEVPDPPEEPITKKGDLWKLGEHRLLCGDATAGTDVKRLMNGAKADMIFTDPPYGMGKEIENDNLNPGELYDWNLKWIRILPNVDNCIFVCWHSPRLFWTALDAGREYDWNFRRYFAYYKPNDMTYPWECWLMTSEAILLFTKGNAKFNKEKSGNGSFWHDTYVWTHKKLVEGEDKKEGQSIHPTIKPIPVCKDLIHKGSFGGQIVYDPFGGSGSSLIACEKNRSQMPHDGNQSALLRRHSSEMGELQRRKSRAGKHKKEVMCMRRRNLWSFYKIN